MVNYDLVITTSSYFSPQHAVRLIKSVPQVNGKILTVVICPHENEAYEIAESVQNIQSGVVILYSVRRERHLCQDLGFVWCLANNIRGRYVMFCDDDIEFCTNTIFPYIDVAPAFSVLGFTCSTMQYCANPFRGEYQIGNYAINPIWIDGNNLITHWEDNLKYGVMDEVPGSFNSSSVEVEYACRLKLLTGKPTVGAKLKAFNHYSRVDNVEKLRDDANQQSVIHEGYKLWQQKFGLVLSAGDFNSGEMVWQDVERTLRQPEYAQLYQRHMIFDMHWTDWDEIWRLYSPGISIVFSNME